MFPRDVLEYVARGERGGVGWWCVKQALDSL